MRFKPHFKDNRIIFMTVDSGRGATSCSLFLTIFAKVSDMRGCS